MGDRYVQEARAIVSSLRACPLRAAHTCSNVARRGQWRSDSAVSTGEQQRAAHATAIRAAPVEAGPVPPGRENAARGHESPERHACCATLFPKSANE